MPDGPAPDVSAIIPCYRQAQYLSTAIESVLGQTVPRVEVFVVDDGPDDAVADVCARYGNRVHLLRQQNAGVSAARNHGLANARGRFLHFLDSDDRILPDLYARSVEALERHPDWILTLCGTDLMLPDGTLANRSFGPQPAGRAFKQVLDACPAIGSMLLRREALARTGLFDPLLDGTEDWDLFIRLARTGSIFGAIPENLLHYRVHPGGKSAHPETSYINRIKVLDRACLPDPRVKDPDPEFSAGENPSRMGLRKARMAVYSTGLALGTGNATLAAQFVRQIFVHLNGMKPPHEFMHQIYQLAARPLGQVDPPAGELYKACANTLAALRKEFPKDSPEGIYAKKIEKAFRGPLPKRAWWKVWA